MFLGSCAHVVAQSNLPGLQKRITWKTHWHTRGSASCHFTYGIYSTPRRLWQAQHSASSLPRCLWQTGAETAAQHVLRYSRLGAPVAMAGHKKSQSCQPSRFIILSSLFVGKTCAMHPGTLVGFSTHDCCRHAVLPSGRHCVVYGRGNIGIVEKELLQRGLRRVQACAWRETQGCWKPRGGAPEAQLQCQSLCLGPTFRAQATGGEHGPEESTQEYQRMACPVGHSSLPQTGCYGPPDRPCADIPGCFPHPFYRTKPEQFCKAGTEPRLALRKSSSVALLWQAAWKVLHWKHCSTEPRAAHRSPA